MNTHKKKFASEVQLGLLLIILTLVVMSFATNFIIFKARGFLNDQVYIRLNRAANAITRELNDAPAEKLRNRYKRDVAKRFKLTSVILIPTQPTDDTDESRRKWFARIISSLPAGQVPEVASKLLKTGYDKVTRGDDNEYFLIHPVPSPTNKQLLIISVNEPIMAYIDDASRNTMYISLIAVLMVTGVYVWLLRFIMSPFKRMKKQALAAGRSKVSDENADIDEVVEDYRQMIDELTEKEKELLRLNKSIQSKADSLERFNEHILESTGSAVFTIDSAGKILSANLSAINLLEIPGDNILGRQYDTILGQRGDLSKIIAETMNSEKGRAYREITFNTRSEQRLHFGVTISPICDEKDDQIGFSILINDLTEIQNLKTALETSTRLSALGEMAGGLAHQLRNSIGAIAGYNRLTEKSIKKANLDTSSVAAMRQELNEAEMLIKRFLTFARPLSIHYEPVNLSALVEDVVRAVKARGFDGEITVSLNTPDNDECELDPLLIKQALGNILDNAIEAALGTKAQIEVAVEKLSHGWRLAIRDHGCGIPEENLKMIFTPFFSSRPSGNGLGLPLAAKIIDLHSGELLVDSVEGEGTEFVIQLPSNRPSLAREKSGTLS